MISPTILIDCGHGGKDTGFIIGTIREKDFTLSLGKIFHIQAIYTIQQKMHFIL